MPTSNSLAQDPSASRSVGPLPLGHPPLKNSLNMGAHPQVWEITLKMRVQTPELEAPRAHHPAFCFDERHEPETRNQKPDFSALPPCSPCLRV